MLDVAQNMTLKMISPICIIPNGTMKNGLDYGNILGGPKSKKAKKACPHSINTVTGVYPNER